MSEAELAELRSEQRSDGSLRVRLPAGAAARTTKKEPAESQVASAFNPKQIPDEIWSLEVEKMIRVFLQQELSTCESERNPLLWKWARWREAYDAPVSDTPKHFPIYNAANFTIPVIKERVNTLAAQVVQSTGTVQPTWIFEELSPEWEPIVDDIERFMQIAKDRDLKFDPQHETWVIEGTKIGTAVMAVVEEVDLRVVHKYSADGSKIYKADRIFQDGPRAYHIPLQRFWIRLHERDIQKARWCGIETDYSLEEMREAEKQGKMFGLNKILSHYQDPDAPIEKDEQKRLDTRPLRPAKFKVFKIYLSWDFDGEGHYSQLMLSFHRESGVFLSRQFSPYWHGKRPFVKFGYFPREHSFYDTGLCEMLEVLQLAVSDKHNKRADSESMSILKMFVKRRSLRSFNQGDPLYQGKIIEAGDIWNDLRELDMSEIHPSTVLEENLLMNYADRLSGVNEGVAGAAMPVTRTTAYAQAALLQEQFKRIDLTVRSVRRAVAEIGQLTLELYFQYGTNGKALAWMGSKGRIVEAVFRRPRFVVELGLAIRAKTPISSQNHETKKQNEIAKFNLLLTVYKEVLPLAQAFAPDQLPMVAGEIIASARKFLTNTLEAFEESDPEGVLAGLAVLERVLPKPEDLGGMESFDRRTQGAEIIDRLTRLDSVLEEARRAKEGSDGLRIERGESKRVAPPERPIRGGGDGLFLGQEPPRGQQNR